MLKIKTFIKYVIKKIRLYRFLYAIIGLKDICKNGYFCKYVKTYKSDIAVYCESYGHFDTVKELLMFFDVSEYKVNLMLNFKIDNIEMTYKNINIFQNIKSNTMIIYNAKILVTPYVAFPAIFKPNKSKIFHLMVSLTSLDGVYEKDMFDDCDYIFVAGKHHLNDFRKWSNKNSKLIGKTIIVGGYPKLDMSIKNSKGLIKNKSEKLRIIYAPTHIYSVNINLASLRMYGKSIINKCLELGYIVIFRPHPVSLVDSDRNLVQEICNTHKNNLNFIFDNSKNYLNTYSQSDVLLTDLSGTGFTYSLTFLRPSIFYAPNKELEINLRGIQYEDREKIGFIARDLQELELALNKIKTIDFKSNIIAYRNNLITNLNKSSQYAFDSICNILKCKEDDKWIKL